MGKKCGSTSGNHQEFKFNFDLHNAILSKQQDEIIKLLQDSSTLVNLRNNEGKTPLILATSSQYREGIDLLLKDVRVDILRQDNNGWSSLMYASYQGDKVTVIQLLDQLTSKSHLLMKNNDNHTAIDLATNQGYDEIAYLIKDKLSKMTTKTTFLKQITHFIHHKGKDQGIHEPLLAERKSHASDLKL